MNIRASSPVWPFFPVTASPQLVVSCSWHRGICYLIACLFVKWLAPADVPMWEFGGQHLYTNSRLHHCSAFDLVMMGHHPGHKRSSKTDLRMNFLIFFFLPPKLFLIMCSNLRSSTSSISTCAFLLLLLLLLPLIFLLESQRTWQEPQYFHGSHMPTGSHRGNGLGPDQDTAIQGQSWDLVLLFLISVIVYSLPQKYSWVPCLGMQPPNGVAFNKLFYFYLQEEVAFPHGWVQEKIHVS